MVDIAEGSLLTSRQLHAVRHIGRVTRSDIALSSIPPVVCTATSHASTEVHHFSLDSHEALPVAINVRTSDAENKADQILDCALLLCTLQVDYTDILVL